MKRKSTFGMGADNPVNRGEAHHSVAPTGLSFGTMMRNAIAAKVSQPVLEQMIQAQVDKATDGDTKAFSELADRMVGRPAQQIVVTDTPAEVMDFSDLKAHVSKLRTLGETVSSPPRPPGYTANGSNGFHRNGTH